MYFRSWIMMFWIDWNMFETFSTPLGHENRICIARFFPEFSAKLEDFGGFKAFIGNFLYYNL